MSEVKIREEKEKLCSIGSPCEKGVCNLDNSRCMSNIPNQLTFFTKRNAYKNDITDFDQGFTGNQKTIFNKIQQAYSYITSNPTCNSGMDMLSQLDYSDKEFNKLQKSLKHGKILGFYDPISNKLTCQKKLDLINYWTKKKDTLQGIILNVKEVRLLKEKPSEMSAQYKRNKKREYFLPLSPLMSRIFIKQSQVNNIFKKGFTFFVVVPTNLTWIDTIETSVSSYHNYNRFAGEYGDPIYMVVPLDISVSRRQFSENKQAIVDKYCKEAVYDKKQIAVFHRAHELKKLLLNKQKLKGVNESFLRDVAQILRYSESLPQNNVGRFTYPYWYPLNSPIGEKMIRIIKTKGKYYDLLNALESVETKRGTKKGNTFKHPIGYPKISYEYNGYLVKPTYITKNEFLVCQKDDVDYEVILYGIYAAQSIQYFSRVIDKRFEQYLRQTNTGNAIKIQFNKLIPYNIEMMKLSKEDMDKIKRSPQNVIEKDVYGVYALNKRNPHKQSLLFGTNIESVTKYYNTIILESDNFKELYGKMIVKLPSKNGIKQVDEYVIRKELFQTEEDEEDEEEDEKQGGSPEQFLEYKKELGNKLLDYGLQLLRDNPDLIVEQVNEQVKSKYNRFMASNYGYNKGVALQFFNTYKNMLTRQFVNR